MICINRNILECKGITHISHIPRSIRVLIETYWNVKARKAIVTPGSRKGINRNILECKDFSTYKSDLERPRINRNILECKVQNKNTESHRRICINRNILECKEVKSLG